MSISSQEIKIREVSITYKPKKSVRNKPQINSSQCAYNHLKRFYREDQIGIREEFNVLFLNRANKVIGIYKMSVGGMHGTVVDIRLLFATALKALATGIILSHNHPSGQLKASDADITITANIKKVCQIMEISLLDHLILDPFGGYMSFADEGLL